MKTKKLRKLLAAICVLTMIVSTVPCFAAVTLDEPVEESGVLEAITVTSTAAQSADVFAAAYESGILVTAVHMSVQLVEGTQTITLTDPLTMTDDVRVFVWDENMSPLSSEITFPSDEPTAAPTATATAEPTTAPSATATAEPTAAPSATTAPTATATATSAPTATAAATATPTATPDGSGETDTVIHLADNNITTGDTRVTIDNENSTVTITEAGTYTIDGSLSDGQICVNSGNKTDEIIINLNGVSVTSLDDAPFNGQKGKVTLLLSGENTFTDTSSTDNADREGACVYSKHDLTIKPQDDATGSLVVNANYNNGIRCKNDMEIGGVDVTVTSTNGNGIKGDESIKFTKKAGTITVNACGDAIKTDYLPEIDSDTGEVVGGTITINGGTFVLTANNDSAGETNDGIQADMLLEINKGTFTINATGEGLKANASTIDCYLDSTNVVADGGDGCIAIYGGTLEISAGEDGVKATKDFTMTDGTLVVKKAEEGIQTGDTITEADLGTSTDDETIVYSVIGSVSISGGTITITSSEDGIQSGTGDMYITSGDITVNAAYDGLQAEDILYIEDGTVTVKAGGGHTGNTSTSVDYSCKGIKAGSLLKVVGGTISVDSLDDSMHSNDTVRISGGTMSLASDDDGVHGDNYLYISDAANIDVTASYEGVEAAEIYVSGGETYVTASDDGLNAAGDQPTTSAQDYDPTSTSASIAAMGGSDMGTNNGNNWNQGPNQDGEDTSSYGYVEMSDGLVYINAEGDGFDSNGSALISGGVLLVNGPTGSDNGAFDIGDGSSDTLTITGGTVIGTGSGSMEITPDSATQPYVVSSSSGGSGGMGNMGGGSISGNAGSAFRLNSSSGSEIVTYIPSKSYKWVFISTPNMTSNTSYTLKYGGSVSGGTVEYGQSGYGLLESGSTYSGGSSMTLSATTK